jgi:hypothetical protein
MLELHARIRINNRHDYDDDNSDDDDDMGKSGSYGQPVDPDSSEIHVFSLDRATRATTPGTPWCMRKCAGGMLVQYTLVKLLWTRFSLVLGRHVREVSELSKFEICKHRESLFTF